MPIYEYKCNDCGEITEEMTVFVSPYKYAPCSKCEGIAEKIISKSNFKLSWDSEMRDQKAGRVRDE